MRRTITALPLAVAATLVLASCASAAASPEAPAAPTDSPTVMLPTAEAPTLGPTAEPTHSHSHSHAAGTPTAGASADHDVPKVVPVDDHDDDAPGAHDDTYKDLAPKKGTTYVVASSTDATRFRLTIESFDCKVEYPDAAATVTGKPGVFTSDAGKELCVATVSGKNIGKAPDWAALNYFISVVDAKKVYYEETDSPNFTTKFLMDGKPRLDENVDPGSTAQMVLGYEVPTSAKGLVLRVDNAPFSH